MENKRNNLDKKIKLHIHYMITSIVTLGRNQLLEGLPLLLVEIEHLK